MTGMTLHTGSHGWGRFTMIAIALWMVFGLAFAHHSFAMFDMSKTLTLAGTVTNFEWTNPHTWLWLQVPDGKGGAQLWGLEGQAPGELTRHGWSRHSVTVGDKISVQIHPLKDGELGGSFGVITFADGTVLSSGLSLGPQTSPQ